MSKYSDNQPPKLRDAIGWMYDYIEDDKVFLDFGCSTGYFGSLIKQARHNAVYGVEISNDVREARKVLDGVYSFDLDGEWPEDIYERKYDYAFYGDVLEHLKDPGKALEKTAKLLKNDGLVFVSTPNIAHMSIRLELMGGNFEYETMGILDNTHLKYFTLRSFTGIANQAGYDVVAVDYSLSDFPDEVIKDRLKAVGLSPTDKFWRITEKPEARAFQYKFVLRRSSSPKPMAVALQKPEQQRTAFVDDLKQKVITLTKHAKDQAVIIEHQKNEIITLQEQAKELGQFKAHKVFSKFHRLPGDKDL